MYYYLLSVHLQLSSNHCIAAMSAQQYVGTSRECDLLTHKSSDSGLCRAFLSFHNYEVAHVPITSLH
jgi:hypothetical protein